MGQSNLINDVSRGSMKQPKNGPTVATTKIHGVGSSQSKYISTLSVNFSKLCSTHPSLDPAPIPKDLFIKPMVVCSSWAEIRSSTRYFIHNLRSNMFSANTLIKAINLSDKYKDLVGRAIDFDGSNATIGSETSFLVKSEFNNFTYDNFVSYEDFNPGFYNSSPPSPDSFISIHGKHQLILDCLNLGCASLGGRLVSMHDSNKLGLIIAACSKFWRLLNSFERDTLLYYISGFEDIIKNDEIPLLQPDTSVWNNDIKLYLDSEISAGRIYPLGRSMPSTRHNPICAKILCIREEKVDMSTGRHFTKNRFVYDNVNANAFIDNLGYLDADRSIRFKFRTPTAECLFLHDPLYKRLNSSKQLSCYDKESFYRQFYISPKNWHISIIKTANQRFWLDVSGRMGAKNSAIFAQRLSSALDSIFNRGYPNDGFCITNQDDTFLMNPSCSADETFNEICSMFGLKLNPTKTQLLKSSVEWAGYIFNQVTLTLKLKPKRLQKIKKYTEILNGDGPVKRREVAIYLGTIHSCRPIICGQKFHCNPLLFWLRKTAYLYDPFYTDRSLHAEFYDEEIKLNSLARFEINLMLEIVMKEVSYDKVRSGLNDYLVAKFEIAVPEPHNVIFSDASSSMVGFGLLIDGLAYSFKMGLTREQVESWSINLKELFSAVLAVSFYAAIIKPGDSGKSLILYVDNTTAQSILASRKTSLKSVEIAMCAKFLELVSYGLNISIKRCPTDLNLWADTLSRSPNLKDSFNLEKLCPFSLLIGSPNPLSHALKMLGIAGEN